MFIAAEGRFGGFLMRAVTWQFQFEGAELLIDDLPDDLIGCHGGGGKLVEGVRLVIRDVQSARFRKYFEFH